MDTSPCAHKCRCKRITWTGFVGCTIMSLYIGHQLAKAVQVIHGTLTWSYADGANQCTFPVGHLPGACLRLGQPTLAEADAHSSCERSRCTGPTPV